MFLDTSGLFCLHHADEPRHADAWDYFSAAGPKVTHGEILSEFATLCLARGLPRRSAVEFVRALLGHPEVDVAWIDGRLHLAALDFFNARPDKRYSFCDAVSFVLMGERGIEEALTTDRHFDQAGFRRLLSS